MVEGQLTKRDRFQANRPSGANPAAISVTIVQRQPDRAAVERTKHPHPKVTPGKALKLFCRGIPHEADLLWLKPNKPGYQRRNTDKTLNYQSTKEEPTFNTTHITQDYNSRPKTFLIWFVKTSFK